MLSFDNSVSFSRGLADFVRLRNFWEPEEGFAWSTGRWCEILFEFDVKSCSLVNSADVIIDLDAYRGHNEKLAPNLKVYLNGLRIMSIEASRRAIQISTFDPAILRAADNVLIIDTPDSHSPEVYGDDDHRILGVQVFSLQFRKNV